MSATLTTSSKTLRPEISVLSMMMLSGGSSVESTEISGRNVFEEVVNVADIVKMRDPLRERLIELVKSHDPNLLPGAVET